MPGRRAMNSLQTRVIYRYELSFDVLENTLAIIASCREKINGDVAKESEWGNAETE